VEHCHSSRLNFIFRCSETRIEIGTTPCPKSKQSDRYRYRTYLGTGSVFPHLDGLESVGVPAGDQVELKPLAALRLPPSSLQITAVEENPSQAPLPTLAPYEAVGNPPLIHLSLQALLLPQINLQLLLLLLQLLPLLLKTFLALNLFLNMGPL